MNDRKQVWKYGSMGVWEYGVLENYHFLKIKIRLLPGNKTYEVIPGEFFFFKKISVNATNTVSVMASWMVFSWTSV